MKLSNPDDQFRIRYFRKATADSRSVLGGSTASPDSLAGIIKNSRFIVVRATKGETLHSTESQPAEKSKVFGKNISEVFEAIRDLRTIGR